MGEDKDIHKLGQTTTYMIKWYVFIASNVTGYVPVHTSCFHFLHHITGGSLGFRIGKKI